MLAKLVVVGLLAVAVILVVVGVAMVSTPAGWIAAGVGVAGLTLTVSA